MKMTAARQAEMQRAFVDLLERGDRAALQRLLAILTAGKQRARVKQEVALVATMAAAAHLIFQREFGQATVAALRLEAKRARLAELEANGLGDSEGARRLRAAVKMMTGAAGELFEQS